MILSTLATPQIMAESLLSSAQIQEIIVRQAQAWEQQDAQPCFASLKAKKQYYDAIWFSRIREIKCSTL